jgi:glycine/D-amino acid oxidase-like deaminating enzyme
MTFTPVAPRPTRDAHDVVIIGGATSGSAIAWHLSGNPDFDGTVLVVEKDASLQRSATIASNNCMRPLTIDPSGVHMRSFGERDHLVGCPPKDGDPAVDADDFSDEPSIWEQMIRPVVEHPFRRSAR